ncbi:MAG: lytic murein transglycosylase [Alphaproteobacteria bacterium]|nr:lytic murein transglycosylase [Alphaproteobacteria bacterium]
MAKRNLLSAFLATAVFVLVLTGDASAAKLRTKDALIWLKDFQNEAIKEGISPHIVHAALDHFIPDPQVIKKDRHQPEKKVSFRSYRRRIVSLARIRQGARLMRRYKKHLAALEKRTGVPPEIVMALWGIESNFGQNTGRFETIPSLATLAYEGRRSKLFRRELMAALRILEREKKESKDLRGSWAGALGQCQFMPSTYLRHAKDGNGDGKRDIWDTPTDVMASIAHYLAAEGWARNTTWGGEIKPSSIAPHLKPSSQTLTLSAWGKKGLKTVEGRALPKSALRLSLVRPDGAKGSAFLVSNNVQALMRWNNSSYFALSVGLLADEIKIHAARLK